MLFPQRVTVGGGGGIPNLQPGWNSQRVAARLAGSAPQGTFDPQHQRWCVWAAEMFESGSEGTSKCVHGAHVHALSRSRHAELGRGQLQRQANLSKPC